MSALAMDRLHYKRTFRFQFEKKILILKLISNYINLGHGLLAALAHEHGHLVALHEHRPDEQLVVRIAEHVLVLVHQVRRIAQLVDECRVLYNNNNNNNNKSNEEEEEEN